MKIFIDTNIFLDLILKREGYKDAMQILNACGIKRFDGYVADITLLNIDYIANKQVTDLKKFIKTIIDVMEVVGADNHLFSKALELDNSDLEDNVQYVCAKETMCEVIVSNDKKFYRGRVEVLRSDEFVARYIEQ
jgi:predicted nucleic acid-binding protein